MSNYAYEARTSDGRMTSGMLTARSLEAAGRTLSDQNLFVLRLAPDTQGKTEAGRAHATRDEVAWCMAQLAVMVETGLRLSESLSCLAQQARTPRLRRLLSSTSDSVSQGRPLSEAMGDHPRSFPGSLIAMIRAAECSGSMTAVLQRSSAHMMLDRQTIRRVRAAMLYPLFMLALCVGVTLFLLIAILPRFAEIFASQGAILPLPTRALIATSNHSMQHWPLWIGICAAACFAITLWARTPTGRDRIDGIAMRTPLLSRVLSAYGMARAFRTMAVLLNAGVPVLDAVRITQDAVSAGHHRRLWRDVHEQISHGGRFAAPMLESPLIPPHIAQMIDSGDRSGKLGFVFNRLADFLESEHEQAVKSATQFIEPLMILCMGGLVGFVAASLMLPLFQAGQAMAS